MIDADPPAELSYDEVRAVRRLLHTGGRHDPLLTAMVVLRGEGPLALHAEGDTLALPEISRLQGARHDDPHLAVA